MIKNKWRTMLAVTLVLPLGSSHSWGASQTWTGATDANWAMGANWSGTPVPGSGDTATFNATITNGNGTTSPVVIDLNRQVQALLFDTANASAYVIGTTGGNALRFNSGGSVTLTSSVVNTQTINAPIEINNTTGSLSLVNNASNSSALLNIGGGVSAVAVSGTTTLTLAGSNTGNNTVSGIIGGGGGATVALTKSGTGTWVLNNANTYTGSTTLVGGNLILDFTATGAPSSNIINSASALTLGVLAGTPALSTVQTLTLQGKNGTATTQTLGAVNFIGGTTHLNLNAGTGGSLTLTLGSFTATKPRSGITLDFGLSANSSVKTATASAVTGTGSGLFANVITINESDFATNNGDAANNLVGLSTIAGAYNTSTTITGNQAKALDVQGDTSFTNNLNLPAIRVNQAADSTLTLAAGVNLTGNGAILVTANVGAHTTVITGGTIAGDNRDLSLLQNNTQGSLRIDSVVADYATNTTGLTKSGRGIAVLTGANTYKGKTSVNVGTLLVNGTHIDAADLGANLASGYGNAAQGHYAVVSGATLGGTGRIAGFSSANNSNLVLVQSGGVIAPGSGGIGTFTLDGGNISGTDSRVLNLAAGAQFSFELAGDGTAADQIAFWNYVSGDLLLNSNAINLSLVGAQVDGTYTVDLFRFYGDGGTMLTASGITSGLALGTLGAGIDSASLIYNSAGGLIQLQYVVTAIPEPSVYALLIVGLLLMAGRRHRLLKSEKLG